MMSKEKCPRCGKFHASFPVAHQFMLRIPCGDERGYSLYHHSILSAANSNFSPNQRPARLNQMSLREAMAQTKITYKETLDYLV